MTKKEVIEIDVSNEWLSDLDMTNVEKSSKLDIIPTLKIAINEHIDVIIKTLPVKTKFADNNLYFTMIVEKERMEYQFNCEAKSFRFQLAVLAEKLGGMDKLIEKTIRISAIKGNTKEFKNIKLYNVSLL